MKRNYTLTIIVLLAVALGGLLLLPIQGQVIVTAGRTLDTILFPQIRLESNAQALHLYLTDRTAWSSVGLTIDGKLTRPLDWRENSGGAVTWHWQGAANQFDGALVFYHSCHLGCVERARFVLGADKTNLEAKPTNPTKLGVASANPKRDWHGRSGWDVQVTYATLADDKDRGIDELAAHVFQVARQNLRVLVRVDYAPGQTLPPANDNVALGQYLDYLRRLARDERLRSVYGYIIASGFNDSGSNSLAPTSPLTPQWYARIFNGYGETVTRADNALQVIRQENSRVKVLVGPVRPFKTDQDGVQKYRMDVPWLNYMNTLVGLLDEAARTKAAAGFALTAPDGFAVNAPGRPNAPELNGRSGADEPRYDLRRAEWNNAQVGFRVYRDWLDIINAYPTTRGLSVYINATNTFSPDEGVTPAQNYPRGWLTTAYEVINAEPQVQALCWFLDFDESPDGRWDAYSLAKAIGRVYDAAEEFDELLKK